MADSKYQKKGHIDSVDDSTDTLIAQNVQDSEIHVHHEVKEGVDFSGQQGDEAIADAVTLQYGGEQEVKFRSTTSGKQEVESHDTTSNEQEVEFYGTVCIEQEKSHSTMSAEQKVESNATVSGVQKEESDSTVSGEQEIESNGNVSGRQEVKSHCTVIGKQEVEYHSTLSDKQEVKSQCNMIGEQEVESHCIVSGVQFTTEGVHEGTVHVEELQPDENGIPESHSPPQDSGMEEVNQELKDKVDYDVDDDGDVFEAAQSGNIVLVKNYLDLGLSPDLTDEEGCSILHHAASHGQVEVIKLLHERGCCIDPVDRHGRTPLHHAATSRGVASIGVLVDLGSNVNYLDYDGNTPLKRAVMCENYSTLEELLKYGGVEDVECEQREEVSDDKGTRLEFIAALDDETVRDLLFQSSYFGDMQTVLGILQHRCPVDVADGLGYTALHRAAEGGHVEVIRELIARGLSANVQANDGYTPLHSAAAKGKLEAVHELLRLGGKASMTKVAGIYGTPLHQAAFGGHKKVMSVLLDEGCPIDVVSSSGQSVLHAAAQGGHVELLGWLVECGLDVNREDADGYTPLHSAACNGKLEAMHELLRLGGKASMTKVAGTYGSPLHQAALGGHKKVMSVLLAEGCPIDVVSSSGHSVLHFAARGGHVELLGWLVECGLDVNRGDADGYTPLHSAAALGKLEVVHELLRLGANPDIMAGMFGTPLHQAVLGGSVQVVTVLSEAMFERYRPQHPMATESEVDLSNQLVCVPDNNPLDCCNPMGLTPLMWAAGEGHVEIVKFLISKHCNFTTQSCFGLSMFEVAVMCGQMNKLHELCKACGFNDLGDGIRESILSLKNRNLFDPCKLLILGECPLSPLHISLILCKILMNYSGRSSIKRGAKDYKVFIDKLISHSSTKYTVNELFPNGLSPLDIARQFDFHDIASMIERAGGGPGLWANLPKQMEQKYIGAFLAVKELIDCDEAGKEATSRILSFLGYQLVGGEEISDANRIMGERPSRSLIDKHVLSKLQHKDKWERVGNLLEVDEGELDRLGEESPSDDEAYYSMLKHWLKHGSQVTWKTLLDAIGYFETKKTVDDITDKIVEELASSQVRKCEYMCYVFLEMTRLEMGFYSSFVILCYRTRPSPP